MSNALEDKNFLISFLGIFFICQFLSLLLTLHFLPQNLQFTIINSNPNSIWNAVFIVGYIIFITFLILILRKFFKKTNYLFLFEFLALFGGISLVFMSFLNTLFSYFFTFVLLFIKYNIKKETILSKWYNNVLLGLAISAAATVMGLSLGIVPVIVLLILLSIYDIIAVFYTKHMIVLADLIIKKNISLIFVLPSKKREYKLGGGDIVIPAVLSTSLFSYFIKTKSFLFSFLSIVNVWLASLLGLFITFYILDKYKKVKALPALPIQVLLMILVVLILI